MKRPAGRPVLGLLLVLDLAAVPLTAAPSRAFHPPSRNPRTLMIAIVRTRTLRALRTAITEAETATQDARADAAAVTATASRTETALEDLRAEHARLIAAAARAEGELETLRAQQLLDTEDRAALRMLLRQARKTTTEQQRVFVLLRRGQFHSVHATREAAEKAAELEGAHPDGWLTHGVPGTDVPASEVAWRIQPVPVAGEAR